MMELRQGWETLCLMRSGEDQPQLRGLGSQAGGSLPTSESRGGLSLEAGPPGLFVLGFVSTLS